MYLVELFEGKLLVEKYFRRYKLTAQSDVRKWERKDNNIGRYSFVPEKL